MKNARIAAAALFLAALPVAAAEFKFPGHTFTVPDGFEVELVAGPPFIERPISMDFDEQGRLYVTISSGSNDNVQQQLAEKPHSIVRLEDTDGDGRFDKKTVFADRMMFPEGAMWFDGSLYVSAPPVIWKLTDTNDDGVADQREEWFDGKTLTGCANDLHGPHLGPDGWIYWCKGAFAEQTHLVNGKPFTTRASHIFRARPDGSRLEPVMTAGMDNPSAVEFTSTGERFLVGTFFQTPEDGKRDGILHAVYGGVYGKVNAVLDGHKRTGDLMPVMTHLGPSASCSIVQYRSRVFGEDYFDNLFVANFNLHNVTRHVMEPHGATFRTRDEVFMSSDNPDFHPTCVLEDADGSLLVVDTGGWYKLCCPTSQLWKPDVVGGIYRIRRSGAPQISDPRGLKIDWNNLKPKQLVRLLDDNRPRVVARAMQQLARNPGTAIPALESVLEKSTSEVTRRNAVWVLTRIDDPKARRAVYAAFRRGRNKPFDPNDTAIQVAIYSIGLWRDRDALSAPAQRYGVKEALITALNSSNAAMSRVAAETIGRLGDAAFGAPQLLQSRSWNQTGDRALEHALIYALIEMNDPIGTAKGLANPFARRGALIALDQMDDGNLKPEQVMPFLNSDDPRLKETAFWIVSRHPEWGAALAGYFKERLGASRFSETDRMELPAQLARFAGSVPMQEVLADALRHSASDEARRIILQAIAASKLKQAPDSWRAEVVRILKDGTASLTHDAVLAARVVRSANVQDNALSDALIHVASQTNYKNETRLGALAILPAGTSLAAALFHFLLDSVQPDQPVRNRSLAADSLVNANLNRDQLLNLAGALKSTGPMETARLLAAFARGSDDEIGLRLVASLSEAATLSSLRVEQLKPVFAKHSAAVQAKAEPLLASLNVDLAQQRQHLDSLLASLKDGDVRRGQAVFNSPKAACSACHAIGYAGGRLGPDLTRIGRIRNERDLLEAIVYPSASFVRSYEPVTVVTDSGDDYTGVLLVDGADEIVLGTGPGSEVRIARNEIQEMRPGTLSVMPAGLDEQLTLQELADLIAFLKAAQ